MAAGGDTEDIMLASGRGDGHNNINNNNNGTAGSVDKDNSRPTKSTLRGNNPGSSMSSTSSLSLSLQTTTHSQSTPGYPPKFSLLNGSSSNMGIPNRKPPPAPILAAAGSGGIPSHLHKSNTGAVSSSSAGINGDTRAENHLSDRQQRGNIWF